MSVKAKLRQSISLQSGATAEQSEATCSKAKAKLFGAKRSNGIVTYRGVMRGIVTENSDGQAWYSIGKALRITARAYKGKALSRLQS